MVINQAERKFDSGASIRFAGQYSIHICCKTQPISTQTLWRQIQGLLRFVVCWITGRFAVNYISTSFLNETWNENYSLLVSTMNSIKTYSITCTNMTYELISGYIYICSNYIIMHLTPQITVWPYSIYWVTLYITKWS